METNKLQLTIKINIVKSHMFHQFWNKMQRFLPNIQKPKLSQQGQNHK